MEERRIEDERMREKKIDWGGVKMSSGGQSCGGGG